jgi:hypothetical protein
MRERKRSVQQQQLCIWMCSKEVQLETLVGERCRGRQQLEWGRMSRPGTWAQVHLLRGRNRCVLLTFWSQRRETDVPVNGNGRSANGLERRTNGLGRTASGLGRTCELRTQVSWASCVRA